MKKGNLPDGGPVELAGVDDDAADRGAVAPDPLGGRLDHHVGAVLDGAAQVAAGREGVVDDERDAVVVGQPGQRRQVGDVVAGVADGLHVERLGLAVDGPGQVRGLHRVDQLHLDAEPRQRHLELVEGASVEPARRDDVVADLGDVGDGEELGRVAGGGGQRRHPALERRHPLLEDVGGRVHEAGVDVPERLEGEEVGPVLGRVEGVGGGLVDGHRARVGAGGGLLAGVHLQGLEAGLAMGGEGHGRSFLDIR